VLLYGLLIGGTWTRRNTEKMFDTVSTLIFIAISAIVSVHLVIVGVKQSDAFQKARDRLDCVAIQLDLIRVQAPMSDCNVHWDGD
jgi:hypothetical protein